MSARVLDTQQVTVRIVLVIGRLPILVYDSRHIPILIICVLCDRRDTAYSRTCDLNQLIEGVVSVRPDVPQGIRYRRCAVYKIVPEGKRLGCASRFGRYGIYAVSTRAVGSIGKRDTRAVALCDGGYPVGRTVISVLGNICRGARAVRVGRQRRCNRAQAPLRVISIADLLPRNCGTGAGRNLGDGNGRQLIVGVRAESELIPVAPCNRAQLHAEIAECNGRAALEIGQGLKLAARAIGLLALMSEVFPGPGVRGRVERQLIARSLSDADVARDAGGVGVRNHRAVIVDALYCAARRVDRSSEPGDVAGIAEQPSLI